MIFTPRRPRTVASIATAAALALALSVGGCRAKPPRVYERPVGPIDPPALARTWKAPLDLKNDAVNELHAAGEYVFAYTRAGRAYVLDRNTGTMAHVVQLPGTRGLRAPVVLPDAIVYPTAHTLEVYDRSGRLRQSVELGLPPRTGAVGSGTTVYVGTDFQRRGQVLAVDTVRQVNQIRPLMTLGALSATPATAAGIVYIGSEDGRVYAGDEDFAAAWGLPGGAFQTGGAITADLAADAYGVYVASTDSKLYCLNPKTGQLRWQFYGGTALRQGPVATEDMVFQHVPTRGLVAIQKQDPDPTRRANPLREAKWTAPRAARFLAADERYVYVLGNGDRVEALDKQTGEPRFTSQREDFKFFATNTSKDGVVYAATAGGNVYAIDAVTAPGQVGEVVWAPAAGETGWAAVARAD